MQQNHSVLFTANIFILILSTSAFRQITSSDQKVPLYTETGPVLTDPWQTGLISNQATISCLHFTETEDKDSH